MSTNGARHVDPLGLESPSSTRRRKWPWAALAVLIALSIPGVILGRAVQAFVNPNQYEIAVDQCAANGSQITVSIEITNRGDDAANFSIFVEILSDPFQQVVRSVTLRTNEVRPDRTARVTSQIPSSQRDIECVVVAVGGKLPFGIDLGPIEPVRSKAP